MFESADYASNNGAQEKPTMVFPNATAGFLHEIMKRATQEAQRYNNSLQIQRQELKH